MGQPSRPSRRGRGDRRRRLPDGARSAELPRAPRGGPRARGRSPSCTCGARTRRTSSSTSPTRSSARSTRCATTPASSATSTRSRAGSVDAARSSASAPAIAPRRDSDGSRWPDDGSAASLRAAALARAALLPAGGLRLRARRRSRRRCRPPSRVAAPDAAADAGRAYLEAWAAGDYAAMHATARPGPARALPGRGSSPSCTPRSPTWRASPTSPARPASRALVALAAGASARGLPRSVADARADASTHRRRRIPPPPPTPEPTPTPDPAATLAGPVPGLAVPIEHVGRVRSVRRARPRARPDHGPGPRRLARALEPGGALPRARRPTERLRLDRSLGARGRIVGVDGTVWAENREDGARVYPQEWLAGQVIGYVERGHRRGSRRRPGGAGLPRRRRRRAQRARVRRRGPPARHARLDAGRRADRRAGGGPVRDRDGPRRRRRDHPAPGDPGIGAAGDRRLRHGGDRGRRSRQRRRVGARQPAGLQPELDDASAPRSPARRWHRPMRPRSSTRRCWRLPRRLVVQAVHARRGAEDRRRHARRRWSPARRPGSTAERSRSATT